MVERPDVVGERQNLRRVELGSAHRRHTAAIVLRRWHALGDGRGDRGDAAVAPSPFAGGQVWRERRALGVGAVASGARAAIQAVENLLTEFHLLRGLPGRRRQASGHIGTGIGMHALWRLHLGGVARRASCRALRGSRSRLHANRLLAMLSTAAVSGPLANSRTAAPDA